MSPLVRLALGQVNMTVGDLQGNRDRILTHLDSARALGVDIVVFPELAVTGYPPEDLLLKQNFIASSQNVLEEIAKGTGGLTAIVGTVLAEGDVYNAAAVLHDGRVIAYHQKQFLPNYGVFDENRYFRAGRRTRVFQRSGLVFGVSVCEDIWYPNGPAEDQVTEGRAQLLINISSSPYHVGKARSRERMLATRASDSAAFLAYCNMVGGQDELVFDGQSLVIGPQGDILARAAQFEEDLLVVDIDAREAFRARLREPRSRGKVPGETRDVARIELADVGRVRRAPAAPRVSTPMEPREEVYRALVLGTRDYAVKNRFARAVVGLSGGIDSSLTAAVACDALGAENVAGVAMPTRYSSSGSLKDAEDLARNLGIKLLTIPIDAVFQAFLDQLASAFSGTETDLTEENLQPRIRGAVLMALSNKFGWLVLTTGNKSEVSVGYSTLYGDTAGGFAVIKDVPKVLVYELARYRNQLGSKQVIPRSVLSKAPSAELRPGQKDSDTLPEYEVLDPILQAYVEESRSISEIVALGADQKVVLDVVRRVDRSEYKRRQSAPGIKITPRAFGRDWRLPITNRFEG